MGFKLKSIWSCEFITPKRMISNGIFAFKDIMAYLSPIPHWTHS
jgi:hypothetical protein